ncbi:MAG: hypothetical protein AAFX78_04585 [Cyanobacteria bacterium J06638_20]
MLNRIKAIKDLFLEKLDTILQRLDRLDDIDRTTKEIAALNRRLETFAEAQLENEAALLQSSIRTLQLLDPAAALGKIPLLLLGDGAEMAAVQGMLDTQKYHIQTHEWDWGMVIAQDISDADTLQIVLCKLPQTPEHWEALQKLQHRFPGRVAVCAGFHGL